MVPLATVLISGTAFTFATTAEFRAPCATDCCRFATMSVKTTLASFGTVIVAWTLTEPAERTTSTMDNVTPASVAMLSLMPLSN